MPLLQWNERFMIGIAEVDQQHKELMDLVNGIYDAFKQGASVADLKTLLEILISATKSHFRCEEHWMQHTSYPHLLEHQNEHEKFEIRIGEIDFLLAQGLDNSLDLMLFLNNWIRHHLIEVDAKFADHVVELSKREGSAMTGELPFHLKVKKYLSS